MRNNPDKMCDFVKAAKLKSTKNPPGNRSTVKETTGGEVQRPIVSTQRRHKERVGAPDI